jgi:hypothetical protein
MSERASRWRYLPHGVIALVVGIVEPHVEIAWKCRGALATSEPCVWGRSLLPLGLWIAPIVIAPVLFACLVVLTYAWSSWRNRS